MLVTKKELAKALKVSERHIERMVSLGQWPFYRFSPRVIRFDPEEVKALGRLISEGKPENPKEEIRK